MSVRGPRGGSLDFEPLGNRERDVEYSNNSSVMTDFTSVPIRNTGLHSSGSSSGILGSFIVRRIAWHLMFLVWLGIFFMLCVAATVRLLWRRLTQEDFERQANGDLDYPGNHP